MSLTRLLKNDPDIKFWFSRAFKSPGLKETLELLVEPARAHGAYSGLIGTSFDYVMRFYLQFINDETIITRNWVAEAGLRQALEIIDHTPGKEIAIGYNHNRFVNKKMLIEQLNYAYKRAQEDYAAFVRTGMLTDAVVQSAIFLAKLDIVFRTGIIDAAIDLTDDETVEELKFLFTCVPWDRFHAKQHCILNPTFGEGSNLVGGADADLIIDDTLIDIKCTRHFKLQREDLNQVMGYYLLSIIGGVDDVGEVKINNVGIYFARYGYLWECALSSFYSEQGYTQAVKDFIRVIQGKKATLDFLVWDI